MIVFCDEYSKPLIQELRKDREDDTTILTTDFSDFFTYRYYAVFQKHQEMDHELGIGHNAFLYMIWNEKSHFLKKASYLNPYCSDYFLWVDIGCFRDPQHPFLSWPNPEKIANLEPDKILLLQVQNFSPEERVITQKEDLPNFQYSNRIGGTIFGGNATAIQHWHTAYYEMLEYFIQSNRFIGKDQSIMNALALVRRDLTQIVDWKMPCRDIWFYLQDYLA